MKIQFDQHLETPSNLETAAVQIPVPSPAMSRLRFTALCLVGDGMGGSLRYSATIYTDADGHSRFVGAPVFENSFLPDTIHPNNPPTPRVWATVIEPNETTGEGQALQVMVQGPTDVSTVWRVFGSLEVLGG